MRARSLILAVLISVGSVSHAQPSREPLHERAEYDDFRIWHLQWNVDTPAPTHRFEGPIAVMYVRSVIVRETGGRSERVRQIGDVDFIAEGSLAAVRESPVDRPLIAEVIELRRAAPLPARQRPPRFAPAFPREDAENILENDRIAVWRYTLRPEQPLPLLWYEKPSVIVWLDKGTVSNSHVDGKPDDAEVSAGGIRWNAGSSIHGESAATGPVGVVYLQIK
jgi:hypothetical protein